MSAIDELASRSGVASEYTDYQGNRRVISEDTRRRLLHALGRLERPGADADEALRRALDSQSLAFQPVAVVRAGRACELVCCQEGGARALDLEWCVTREDGVEHAGVVRTGDIDSRTTIGAHDVQRRRLTVPVELPPGYHELRLTGDGGVDTRIALIAVPPRCYEPPGVGAGARCWGVAVQLYTLRSASDWGMGDFGDLRELVAQAAARGADFVSLNPLHALYPSRPSHCSPYGPSSRVFLNVLYVDVAAVPELSECARAREIVEDPAFAQRLAELRAADLVDYGQVAQMKLAVLRELHACFRARHGDGSTARARSFRAFVAQAGETLASHALFDALSARFHGRGWTSWPEDYRDPRSQAVQRYAREHAEEVELYSYLQWLADEQLAAAQAEARALGMRIGLYRDLAVGVDADGADAWAAQELYRPLASVGAPPDALALLGQDWGLPPVDPQALRAGAYREFVRLLRMNMRHCGALRIDHVMGLMRQWWVPRGVRADAGGYVDYPFDDLLGILALESQRNRCLVIGEDLGTVPAVLRTALPDAGVHSCRVLYFEKEPDGSFTEPCEYPPLALAAVSTHDLPPLAGYWEGSDLALRDRLGLFPSSEVRARCHAERAADRKALLRALAAEALLPCEPDPDSAAYSQMSWPLAAAIHAYLARSASALMCVQAEDLLLMREAVNLPGTATEHPNWQRKLASDIPALFASERTRELCRTLRAERAGERDRHQEKSGDL